MTNMTTSNNYSYKNKIIEVPKLDYVPDPRGLGCAFFDSMTKYKDNVAQIDGITGEKETYHSLLKRCKRTAIALRSRGVTANDIVMTCSSNHFDSCVPFFASLFIGAKTAALEPTLSFNETLHLLKQVKPKIIFVTSDAVNLIKNVAKEIDPDMEIVVFGDVEIYISFNDFLLPHNDEKHFRPHEIENTRETAIIFFSSGTTGLPKGICINHFGFLMQLNIAIGFKYCIDVTLLFSSLYWITPTFFLGMTTLIGATRIIIPKFDVDVIWKAIHKCKPTLIVAIPFHFVSLYHRGRPDNIDTGSIKHIAIGGGPLIPQQISFIREIFPEAEIYPGYGQTEMAMFITAFKASKPEEYNFILRKPTSSGTGIAGMCYKVVDIETEKILGPNQKGELYIKCDYYFNGYYNQDSSYIWDAEGWYKTGDIVYYDEEMCFFVVDRIKELLKFQSWHIPPQLLENILLTHPAISNALVIGLPHNLDENHPMAIVVLKKSMDHVTAYDIQKYVDEKVDDRKRLRGGVKIVDNIPSEASGKTKRRNIRDMFLRGEL